MSHHATFPVAAPLHRRVRITVSLLLAACSLGLGHPAFAASFTLNAPSTTAQTLGSGAGQTGTVNSTLIVSGSTVAVTISGNNATLTNNGTISQTGTGRAIRDNTGVTGLTVNNNAGALIQAKDADVIQMNVAGGKIVFNNSGTLTSLNASKGGAQAVDFNAITAAGSNTLNNFSTGLIQAQDADAVRTGVNGLVVNSGTIKSTVTTDTGSDGIDAQSNSGANITNNSPGLIEGARHGITGGAVIPSKGGDGTFVMSVTNNLGGTIRGQSGSGINIDGFNNKELVTIVNGGLITGSNVSGDGDGVDVDGLVNLTNTGTIRSLTSFNDTSEGVTVGGGTIVNSGTIQGSIDPAGGNTGTGRGITIAGIDKNPDTDAAIPVQAPYGPTTITNSGLIKGDSDSGIAFTSGLASGFTMAITNQAGGVIEGAGATAATIQTGADNDTVNNAGAIINDGGSGRTAVSLGAGNDQLKITGAGAVVTGGMDGGSGGETTGDKLVFDLGAPDRQFTQNGAITNFEHIDILSGDVGLTGLLSLGADGNTLFVESGGILDLGNDPLSLDHGSVVLNGVIRFNLDGASSHGQLSFGAGNSGGLTLGSNSLLDLVVGYTPDVGTQFTLVNFLNSGSLLGGNFFGLGEGATFVEDGLQFRISYLGNGGHDIVLTRTVPESATTLVLLAGAFGLMALFRRRIRL